MEFKALVSQAMEMREIYKQYEIATYGKTWSKSNFCEGLVGDVGDLMKLVMAKEGIRDIKDIDEKIAHELSDCLWSIIVLADLYHIDLENSFVKNMDYLKSHIKNKLEPK